MSECKCGRELRPGEKRCPACSAVKSYRRKRIAEGVVGVFVFVAALIWKVPKSK